jgi:hypothetical protein
MINANITVYIVKSFHFTPEWGSVEITKVMLYMLNEVLMMSMMMVMIMVMMMMMMMMDDNIF